MKRTSVNAGSVVSKHCFRHRLALHRAIDRFAVAVNALRHQQARSLQDLAMRTDIPLPRLIQLTAAHAAPAWDEVCWLAWAFKVPASTLIGPLSYASGRGLDPAQLRAFGIASRTCDPPLVRAQRVELLRRITREHPKLLDLSLADWPAALPPSLTECLMTEATVMYINSTLMESCIKAIAAVENSEPRRTPPHGGSVTAGDSLDAALSATTGVSERLKALMHRHRLQGVAIELWQANSRSELAAAMHDVLKRLERPVTILRGFEAPSSPQERQARLNQLVTLFPTLAGIDLDTEPDNLPSSLAEFPAHDRQCVADVLQDAGTSMLSISTALCRLAALAGSGTTPHR